MTALFAVGALSMLAQVIILRELVAALFGVELLYVAALGSWLLGTAVGALAGRILPARPETVAAGCAALGLLVPIELVLIRTGGVLTGAVPGAFLAFPLQLLWVLAATVPPAAVCGLLFPPLTGMAGLRWHGLGRAYAVESAGAAVGGAAVTICFWLGASTLQVAIVTTAVALAAGAGAWGRRPLRLAAALGGLAVATAAVMYDARTWDLRLLRWQYPTLADARDTPYARVVITRRDGQMAVFQNGAFAFDTEGTGAEAFADLSAAQHPEPRRALVVGGGLEGVASALRAHAIAAIDNLEVDERAFDLVRSHIPTPGRGGPGTSRMRVVFGEPRRFLKHADRYDLILVATAEPTSGESSRFYTQEFFRACARRLAPGGIIAVRLPAAENVWPLPLARRTASIVGALRHELASVEIVPGATLYLFASNTGLSREPDVLASRLAARAVHARLMTAPYLHYLYQNDRHDEVLRLLAAMPPGRTNRDGAPVCYQYALMLWLAKFYPGLAAASGEAGDAPWGLPAAALLVLAGALVWLRRRARRRLTGFLFAAGLIGMVLETILLLRYQVANGVMFQQVGWLLTCFMAGLTIGGWVFASTPRPGTAPPAHRRLGWVPASVLLAAAAAVWGASSVPWMAGLAATSLMLLATGLAVGGCFADAGVRWPGDRHQAAASLYAADVSGGATGALLATLLLVPLFGLDSSALWMAGLAALAWLITARPAAAVR